MADEITVIYASKGMTVSFIMVTILKWDIVNYVSEWWMWSCQTQQITFNFSGKEIESGVGPKKNLIEFNWIKHEISK